MKYIYITLLAFGLSMLAQKKTDRFTISKIAKILIADGSSTGDFSPLAQKFTYLEKGGQSYVFVSEDGNYILKMFRGSKLQFGFLNPRLKQKAEEDLKRTLDSYEIAFDALSDETGLVAIHFNDQPDQTIEIIDKLKISHKIEASSVPFIIQRRAVLVKERISQLMEKNDLQGAKEHLQSLFSLIRNRMEKKIEDLDPNLAKNFGFIGNQAIEIDGGRFSKVQIPTLDPIERSKEDLQHWINANYPELSKTFHSLYEDFCLESSI